MNPTNLCMFAPEFIPVWGGTGSYTVELVKSLPNNMNIHVITLRRDVGRIGPPPNTKDIETIVKRVLDIHYLTNSSETFFYNLPFQLACLRHTPKLDKKYSFEIMHSHMCHMPDVYLKLFTRLKTPTVVTIHGTIQMLRDHAIIARDLFHDLESGEKSILRFYPAIDRLQQLYVKKISHFIAVSQKTKELATEHFAVDPSKISVVYNGVDIDLFQAPNESELDKRYSRFTIVYIGRIISKKGIDILIKAMPIVLKAFPNACFLFVGGGNVSFYKEMIRSQGISEKNYLFTGHMGYYERAKILREATIFVNPSFFENCSISILEAMSSGCTVVASNVGGNPELIKSDTNGALVTAFDYLAFAERIKLLLGSESLNRELGKAARQTVVTSFSSKKCGAETYEVYKKIINNPQPR
jgi:glycosyltransferase involved in cell wall biosynthesis